MPDRKIFSWLISTEPSVSREGSHSRRMTR